MKLIVTVVDATDVDKVMTALIDQHVSVTHISSKGSLLDPGNSTLLLGLDEKDVPQIMKVIADLATSRQSFIPFTHGANAPVTGFAEVQTGGFQAFVLDVAHFEQV